MCVQCSYLRFDELLSEVNVEEKASLLGRALAHLSQFNLFDDAVILCDIVHDSRSHVLAGRVAKRALLFVHVEEFHGRWTDILPVFVLLSRD